MDHQWCDHNVVDRRRQLFEESLKVLDALRIATGENHIGPLGPCSPCRLQANPRVAADYDNGLPGEHRFAADDLVSEIGKPQTRQGGARR